MTDRNTRHSKVMTIANRLVKQGYNRANAVSKAWALVKMPQLLAKVSGKSVYSTLRAIKDLYQPYMNYGLEIEVIV